MKNGDLVWIEGRPEVGMFVGWADDPWFAQILCNGHMCEVHVDYFVKTSS